MDDDNFNARMRLAAEVGCLRAYIKFSIESLERQETATALATLRAAVEKAEASSKEAA